MIRANIPNKRSHDSNSDSSIRSDTLTKNGSISDASSTYELRKRRRNHKIKRKSYRDLDQDQDRRPTKNRHRSWSRKSRYYHDQETNNGHEKLQKQYEEKDHAKPNAWSHDHDDHYQKIDSKKLKSKDYRKN